LIEPSSNIKLYDGQQTQSLRITGAENDTSNFDSKSAKKRDGPEISRNSGEKQYLVLRKKHVIIVLQFLVGALVTFGGAAFTILALNPFGTVVGAIHLSIGVAGLLGGVLVVRRKDLPRKFLLPVNGVTIIYSSLSESLAGIKSLLPTSAFHDSLIGTIVAIAMSSVLIYILSRR